jgi:hypothetical protein
MNYLEVIINEQKYKMIPVGECACGCGNKTRISKYTRKKKGWIKGRHRKYVSGHNPFVSDISGPKSYRWKGGKTRGRNNYTLIKIEHPKAKPYVFEYILKAEKALGKPLPEKAHVHHHNENQLVICEDAAYHNLIHQRQRAYKACGHASWRKCWICKEYDNPQNLNSAAPRHDTFYHKSCKRIIDRKYKEKKRQQRHGDVATNLNKGV